MYFASDFALVEAEAAPVSVEAAPSSIAPSAFRERAAMMPSRPPPQRQPAPTTNVIQVRVGAVGEPAPLATGDPTICGHCNGEVTPAVLQARTAEVQARCKLAFAAAVEYVTTVRRASESSTGSPQPVGPSQTEFRVGSPQLLCPDLIDPVAPRLVSPAPLTL